MRLRGVICVVAGHRWAAPTDARDTAPTLRCRRCESQVTLYAGTHGTEGWVDRAGRAERAGMLMDPRDERRR